MTIEERNKMLQDAAERLGEFFNNVVVMASWTDENRITRGVFQGSGDWYARQGLAREYIQSGEARNQAYEIGKEINRPDSGEDWKKI